MRPIKTKTKKVNRIGEAFDTVKKHLTLGNLVVIFVIAFMVIFFKTLNRFFKKIFGLLDDGSKDEIEKVEEQKIKDVQVKQLILSKPLSHYKNIADAQETKMKGWGTADDIHKDLENLTRDELMAVYHQFGTRNYSGTKIDLMGWYAEELSTYVMPNFFFSGVTFGLSEADQMRQIWSKTGKSF